MRTFWGRDAEAVVTAAVISRARRGPRGSKGTHRCAEYRPFLHARLRGARNEFLLVAGDDLHHTARM